jgi:ABC-2 type transport system ATP-binding protein
MAARLSASGLTKWFGQVIAVNDLSFESDAPVVGLLGPNGAGKSTLIKLLVGQLKPSKGEVRLLGETPWANPRLMARLGYCPEHDRFYESLTAVDFVQLLNRLHGYPGDTARYLAGEALEQLGLTAQAGRPISDLSHGMRQRLKLAQAVAHRPGVLILDEPLSGLDPINRSRLIELIRKQAAAGVTVLVSSHVLHELELITDHILLLHRGRMVAQGQVQRIRELIDAHPHRIGLMSSNDRWSGSR